MLTERSIINFLIWTGGLIIGPYLAVSTVEFNFYPAAAFAGAFVLAGIFGLLRDRLCVLPLVGGFIAGKINLIPVLHPAPTELFPLIMILYYLVAYIALQRKKALTGPFYFFIPILLLCLITLYHEHSFGLRSMGGGRQGGRPAIFVLVAGVTYVFGVSINTPSPRFLATTPLLCLAAGALSAIPYAITTYFPGAAGYFYIFTDNINVSAYTSAVLDTGDIVRSQGQATFGATLMCVLLAYFPFYTWWRPHRWWVAILALGCVALVILGGFRSALAVFGLTIFVAVWCYHSWRALFLFFPIVLGIFLATALQDSHVIHLPESAQRSLAFLPGDWDPEVLGSTLSSNEFRQRIQAVYLREDAKKHPLLGNGLSYDSSDFLALNDLALTHETPDNYYLSEEFVVSKQFHSGWISLYDAVGVIGFAIFLFFTLSLVWVSGRMVFHQGVDRRAPLFPLKVWLFCNILPSLIGYFTVFGDFKYAFPGYCFFAILWTHLNRIEKFGYQPSVPVREVVFDPSRTEISVPA